MKYASPRSALTLLGIAAIASPALAAVTTESLLDEMVDLRRLTKFPDPAYTTKQFSSYDPASKTFSDHAGWFANGDRGHYIRVEDVDGRKEHVMMDAKGPGAMVRIWSANPEGTLRVYLDSAKEPVITADMKDILGGKYPGIPTPIAGERARGWNLYFPIPYAKRCKITSDKGGFYYHVNYRTYEAGTDVVSFKADELTRLGARINDIAQRLSNTRAGGGPPAERTKKPFDVTLRPDANAPLWEMDGPKAVCGFLVHLEADDMVAAARQVVLTMKFHGERKDDKGKPVLEHTVETPIGDFFGTAPGLVPYESFPLGITDDNPQDMWCHWWMPFNEKAAISVRNLGGQDVRVFGAVAVMPEQWNENTLLFHAKWRIEKDVPTRPMSDWMHLACGGTKGRFVGGSLHIINPVRDWWGEGDEKIYVDGETFPSHFGTGTEDYYGYAWCCNERFVHAYHNQPICDGPGNFGNTSNNRFHIIDDIPYTKSFKFDIENWHWHQTCNTTRAAISYWYARPGGWDFFGPITRDDVRITEIPEPQVFRVPGAIEGEKMKVIAKTGTCDPQGLGDRFSGETHMWWRDSKPGDKLTLGFNADKAGRQRVIVRLTRANDYGIVQLRINGQKAGDTIDLYNNGVAPTEEIDLGSFDLKKGENTLTAEIVGANDDAVKAYMFGIDYLLLR